MAIIFSRVEERLIHGQIAFMWSNALQFDAFIVIDDMTAKDEVLKTVMEFATPRNKRLFVFTEKEAIEMIPKIKLDVFLIAKSPMVFLNLYNNGILIEQLNIGSIHYNKGKKEIYKTVFVSEEEIEALKTLIEKGVVCEIQKLPTEKKIDIQRLL
jgi:mannose/fructose/N-acetylgalactosamine-specific phosphotransferase system component IIB